MPTYSIGLCLTPWTSHTDTVYNDTSRAAHGMFPPYSPVCCCHRGDYARCFCLRDAPRPVCSAAGSYRHTTVLAHYLQVPFPTLMTATSPAAMLLVSRAEVRWLGYAHARRHCPSIVCLWGQGMPQYALWVVSVVRGTP